MLKINIILFFRFFYSYKRHKLQIMIQPT